MSAAWSSKTARDFPNRRREFEYGCRPTTYNAYYKMYLGWLDTRRVQAHFPATFISMFDLNLLI